MEAAVLKGIKSALQSFCWLWVFSARGFGQTCTWLARHWALLAFGLERGVCVCQISARLLRAPFHSLMWDGHTQTACGIRSTDTHFLIVKKGSPQGEVFKKYAGLTEKSRREASHALINQKPYKIGKDRPKGCSSLRPVSLQRHRVRHFQWGCVFLGKLSIWVIAFQILLVTAAYQGK